MRKRFLPNFRGRPQQSGISVIAGIFLLLLMAVLAAVMVSLVSTSNVNMATDIAGARAYQAARAGAEWGMFQLDPNAQNAGLPNCVNGGPAIPGYGVAVTCAAQDYTEAGRQIRIYWITSVATAAGIERRIEATVEKCRDPVNITAAPYDC
jgi:MSHA biogenesis protein MshP